MPSMISCSDCLRRLLPKVVEFDEFRNFFVRQEFLSDVKEVFATLSKSSHEPLLIFFVPSLFNTFRNWILDQGLKGFCSVILALMKLSLTSILENFVGKNRN